MFKKKQKTKNKRLDFGPGGARSPSFKLMNEKEIYFDVSSGPEVETVKFST